jgi:hypothetical protein
LAAALSAEGNTRNDKGSTRAQPTIGQSRAGPRRGRCGCLVEAADAHGADDAAPASMATLYQPVGPIYADGRLRKPILGEPAGTG